MRQRISLVLSAMLIMIFGGAVLAQDATPTPLPPIKVGFVADQTGTGYLFAQSQLAGLQIAITEINQSGGLLGRPLELIIRDSQLKPDVGATVARQMIQEDGVELLIGPTSSAVALAVSEVAKEFKIPVAFHTSNTAALTTTKWHPYLVQVVPNTTMDGRVVAQLATDLGKKAVGFIAPDYAFGRDLYAAFEPRYLALNSDGQVVTQQWPKLGERDLTPFVSALQATAPDLVAGNLWGDQLVTFMQQAEPLGVFEDSAYIGLFDLDFLKAIGDQLPSGDLYGYARVPFYAVDTEAMSAFVEKYKRLTAGQYPSDWAIMAYDGLQALKSAVEKAGTTEGDAVASAFDELQFASLRGDLTIRACDHMANVGVYAGKATYVEAYPFPILTDVIFYPAEDIWNTCDEIATIRASQ
jgi:branched-chain amino acid transport system substrate-binding protein